MYIYSHTQPHIHSHPHILIHTVTHSHTRIFTHTPHTRRTTFLAPASTFA